MLRFLVLRLLQAGAVLLVVAFLSFCLFQFVGDPVNQMLGQEASELDRAELRHALGLDESVWVQFARFVGHAAVGDFGVSLRQGRPVGDLFLERLPATLELALVAFVIALVLGGLMGVVAAVFDGRWLGRLLMGVSLVGISLPTFLIGVLLILLFSVVWPVLPSFGRGPLVHFGPWSTGLLTWEGWSHLLLPAVTLATFQIALFMRLVRAEMLEVLNTSYIRFARARGLSDRTVYFGHALKNTLLPVVTVLGLQLGSLIAFSIVTESVFQWPGSGQLFLQAVTFADVPVLAAYLLGVALVFVVINLLVDVFCLWVDPRTAITVAKSGAR